MNLDEERAGRLSPSRLAWWRLGGIDRRVVEITALFAALEGRNDWLGPLLGARWLEMIVAMFSNEITGFLVLILAVMLMRLRRASMPRPVALALAVFVGCLIGRAIGVSIHGAHFPQPNPSVWTSVWFFARQSMVLWGFLAAAWYFLQRSNERRATLHASELAQHVVNAQQIEARLQTLHAQVEPHFLFNTLAHVKQLYRTDPALARQMLDSFCTYLQNALPQMRVDTSTLGTEVALVAAYLEVQRIRMGDRLGVEIAVSDDDQPRPFPSMMLPSLVENAIKHGLNPLPEGGTVRVSAESAAGVLRVVVADSGRGFSTSRGTGVGLANIRGRLEALYGAAARITLSPNVPRGIRATIEIPAAPSSASAD